MKTESMSIKEFMSYKKKDNKVVCKTLAVTAVIAGTYLTGFDIASASSSIDAGAQVLYSKLLLVGKWIIIIKGAIDTVNSVVQGDLGGAKRNFLGYLIVYLVLNALPWAMNEVDNVFKELN